MDVIIEQTHSRFRALDFLGRPEINGESFRSPIFMVTDSKGKSGECELIIYPKGYKSKHTGFVSIFLVNRSNTDLHFSYKLSLEDKDGKHQEIRIKKNILCFQNRMLGFRKYLNLENLKTRANALLPNGVLTLVLEIIKPGPELAAEPAADFYDKDLETVWLDTDRDFSDIQISSNGKIFSCHRVLLAARSPVLRAMCQTHFLEGNTREINMDSIDTQIVEVRS